MFSIEADSASSGGGLAEAEQAVEMIPKRAVLDVD